MESLYNKCGWVGSILLAMCALPETIITIHNGWCALSWGLLIMWLLGELFCIIPIIMIVKKKWLIFNYSANLFFLFIMIYYKL